MRSAVLRSAVVRSAVVDLCAVQWSNCGRCLAKRVN